MRGRSRTRYRADRMRALVGEVDYLRAERRRLETLLAEALLYAGHHTGCKPLTLLEVFAETRRINLACPAWVEERDRERRAA